MSDAGDDFLPYGRQQIAEDDIEAVAEVLRSRYLTTGPEVAAFEADFAKAAGACFAVVCNSGTAALHLAALALGIGPGDSVIVPSQTFVATANAARYVGAEVVFSDVSPTTGLLRREDLEQAIARAAKKGRCAAIFPVHINGQCVDMRMIAEIAGRHGLRVVEDACHAIGGSELAENGEWHPVGACRHSDMAIFSLHPVKTITMGEGGVVTTNDAELHRRLTIFRSHGISRDKTAFQNKELAFGRDGLPNPWYYEMQALGFNYRASDINCALGRSQLRKLDRFVAARRRLREDYVEALGPLRQIVTPIEIVPHCRPAWHLNVVQIDFATVGVDRATVMRRLTARGIGSQVHYIPVHTQPYYRERYGALRLPGAERYYDRCLSLPLYPEMGKDDVHWVTQALSESLRS
jgi:UDP-4-amino-4,6-dideoxy-N-acetyl-beta-L-altrosamine transaminase